MKPSLSIKTLFSTPFKTLLTFFLLAAVTFALFSRVAEYSITSREIKNAAKEYRGVGSAEISAALESYPDNAVYIFTDQRVLQNRSKGWLEFARHLQYQALSQEQINALSKLPYVTASSTRYMTAGVSDKYYRLDEGAGYYYYSARFVIEGALSEANCGIKDNFGRIYNNLILNDCTLLAGNPSWLPEGKKIEIYAYPFNVSEQQDKGMTFSYYDRVITQFDESYIYDSEYIKNLGIGDRYVIVGRLEPMYEEMPFYLGDHLTNSWCPAVQSIKGQPENYLETGRFTALRELIDMTNQDLHTFDVVYTDDMSSIMRFAKGDMAVASGRELTREDSINKSNVCVVSSDFAVKNNLVIGDKLTLRLGTELFEQYKGLGAVAAAHERYSLPKKTVELEIVGTYINTDGYRNQLRKPNWSYSKSTVFVPESLLPLDESKLNNRMFSPGEFSFTVGNAWDITSFLEKADPMIREMGLTPIFYDDGWPQIVDEFILSTKLSIIAIIALSGAAIVAIGFIVFLFIVRKKKEYAVMRALGTTRKASARALILPLMVLSMFAVFAGSCAAWMYTTSTVVKTNDALSKIEEYAVNTSIPLTTAAGCILGEIFLLLIFSSYGLWKIGVISPLMLLQDNQNKRVRNRKLTKPACIETKAYVNMAFTETTAVHMPYIGENSGVTAVTKAVRKTNYGRVCGHVLHYVVKHIRRSASKSVLAILMPALILIAVGQFTLMHRSYINLCNNVEIKARFLDGLQLASAIDVAETDYVENIYYEYTNRVDVNPYSVQWAVTNDIARYTGEETAITYAEGYDESCMKKLGEVCIAGKKLMEANGLKPGDKIHVTRTGALENLQASYVQRYKREHPEDETSNEKILELYNDQIMKEFATRGAYYTIAGIVTAKSDQYNRMFFSPGNLRTDLIFRYAAPLDIAEYKLADNLRAEEFRSYAAGVVSANVDELLSKDLAFYMDTSKLDKLLNTLNLMEKLYPVVIAAAVLIGGLVCGLIVIQAAKEAAIMRVLGTTRRRTRAILAVEQVILCLAGLTAGACGLMLYNGVYLVEIALKMYILAALYFAGCLAGTLTCSIITLRRNVLELLQVKE